MSSRCAASPGGVTVTNSPSPAQLSDSPLTSVPSDPPLMIPQLLARLMLSGISGSSLTDSSLLSSLEADGSLLAASGSASGAAWTRSELSASVAASSVSRCVTPK
ncbi:hypothetical protein T484DRAFT_3503704 [Baffinella frigidus]|nr:hypothetical protein T484DRAFT_3503704 [Cryptophyta sp. CCMP2293]